MIKHGDFWSLFSPKVKLGCIWLEVLSILLNVNLLVKEIQDICRWC